jgi:hypothetical protein
VISFRADSAGFASAERLQKGLAIMSNSNRQGQLHRRTGLTLLEFIGCAIAVAGGLWLGALYVGLDLRHLAYTTLSEAHLLEAVPSDWQPAGPNDGKSQEELAVTLNEELRTLRNDVAALRQDSPATTDANSPADSQETRSSGRGESPEETPEKTLAYWLRINEIARNEATLQQEANVAFNQEKAAKVFALKARSCHFAAEAVQAVPTAAVAEPAAAFGRQLVAWYERGGALYDRAVQIWETPSQGRAPLNADWSRAELQHRNEGRLLNEKASAVRGTLSRQFATEFPAFASPATESAPLDSGQTSQEQGQSGQPGQ